jgi:hypothetical protein
MQTKRNLVFLRFALTIVAALTLSCLLVPVFALAESAEQKPAPTTTANPGNFLATFKDYPPRMKAASFSLDRVIEQMMSPSGAQ